MEKSHYTYNILLGIIDNIFKSLKMKKNPKDKQIVQVLMLSMAYFHAQTASG